MIIHITKKIRRLIFLFGLLGTFGVCHIFLDLQKYFFLNLTKSMPRGLYKVIKETPKVGSLVIIDLPVELKSFYVARGYINQETLLLKMILAGEEDFVCQQNHGIIIKKKSFEPIKLPIRKTDRYGAKLPLLSLCRKLKKDEFFVGGINQNTSLDSRYFGVILSTDIIQTVTYIF